MGICKAFLDIHHIVGMFFDCPDIFYVGGGGGGLRASLVNHVYFVQWFNVIECSI